MRCTLVVNLFYLYCFPNESFTIGYFHILPLRNFIFLIGATVVLLILSCASNFIGPVVFFAMTIYTCHSLWRSASMVGVCRQCFSISLLMYNMC